MMPSLSAVQQRSHDPRARSIKIKIWAAWRRVGWQVVGRGCTCGTGPRTPTFHGRSRSSTTTIAAWTLRTAVATLGATAEMTPKLTLGYRDAVAVSPSWLADVGTRVTGLRTVVHACYLHLH